jgi:hypothetical protein
VRDGRRHVGGVAEAAERRLGDLRRGVRAVRRVHVRVGRTGMDHVRGDAARAQVACQAADEAPERRLAHRVEGDARDRHAVGEARADRDHAPAVPHVADRGLRRDEHAADVQRERAVELLERHVLDRPVGIDARVGDEDVEPAEPRGGPLDRRAHGLRVGAVRVERQRAAAGRLHPGGHAARVVVALAERDRDVRAVGRQPLRDRRPDAAAAARDQRDLALQLCHSGSSEIL